MYVGNPVRREILDAHRLEGLARFGLSDKLPVILVTGGSQGAAQINDVVVAALPELLQRYQIIHQTGDGELERIKFDLAHGEKIAHIDRYHPYDFILKDMGEALAAADLVVGRAGVGTINESAVLGKPTVLIPNYQMAGHQVANAKLLSRQGAARVLDGQTLTPAKLVGELDRIMGNPDELRRLGEGIRAFSRPKAAHDLAELILSVGRAG